MGGIFHFISQPLFHSLVSQQLSLSLSLSFYLKIQSTVALRFRPGRHFITYNHLLIRASSTIRLAHLICFVPAFAPTPK